MNPSVTLGCLVLSLLIGNALSIAWAIDKGLEWRAIDVPLPTRTFMVIQLGVVVVLGGRLLYELFVQPSSGRYATGLFLLWFALLNGLSAYSRWRRSLPPKQ